MKRQTFALGLGITLAFIAVPAAAQTVHVGVGVHAGPISGWVVYGAPPVYHVPPPPHVIGYSAYEWEHGRRHAKYERKRLKAERKYYQRLHRLEHEHERAHRRYEWYR